MEVDTPTTAKHIKIHPLSIITISDHHTRIISGGSALPPSSPTIGLLFGTRTHAANNTLSIVDAEELDPTTSSEGGENQLILTKIELHRKVFPLHHVVGWYRVTDDQEPTQADLRRNQLEISQYCNNREPPVFLLMNPNTGSAQTYDLVQDDQLPLTVYETLISNDNNGENENENNAEESKHTETAQQTAAPRPPSELDGQLDSLQSSIRAMNARMKVLLEFLHKVEKGEVPRDDVLLRSVDGILKKLPLVYAALTEGVTSSTSKDNGVRKTPLRELENEYNDTMLLSYLAAVAKTVKTVHVYTEKYRNACESRRM
eukprot:scaffold11749_cov77-Cyclotella_meneghiniana.AAC.6